MICGTFILAFQNIVAKTVERNVPPMQVVFVRSLLSGMVTFGTICRRHTTSPNYDRNARLTVETFVGDRALWHLCAIAASSGPVAFSLAYISLTYLTVGDSVAIFFLNPIFSARSWRGRCWAKPWAWWRASPSCAGLIDAADRKTAGGVRPGAPRARGRRDHGRKLPRSRGGRHHALLGDVLLGRHGDHQHHRQTRERPVLGGVVSRVQHGDGRDLHAGAVAARAGHAQPTEWALLILLAVTSFFGQLSLNYGYSHLPTLVGVRAVLPDGRVVRRARRARDARGNGRIRRRRRGGDLRGAGSARQQGEA